MKRSLILFLFLIIVAARCGATGLLAVPSSPGTYLLPKGVEVTTTVSNQVAITVTRQTFVNTTGHAIGVQYLFPTAISATVSGFRWWQNGELRIAQMAGRPQDTSVFSAGGTGGWSDSKLTSYLGSSPFVFPFRDSLAKDSTIVVELTYMELLKYRGGTMEYHYPAAMAGFAWSAIPFSLKFTLGTDRDLVAISSSSHPDMVIDKGPRAASAQYDRALFQLDRDISIGFSVAQNALGVSLLSNKPSAEDGYFIMLAEPDPATTQDKVIDKTFTFIIDVSGSMGGEKIEQAKEAARYTISHLNPDDRFNVIKFSTNPEKFRPTLIDATIANVNAALSYIDALVADGSTNLEGALLLALGQDMPDTTANVVIFLTDGLAPLDQARVKSANTKNTRIFVFGVGPDVDKNLLTQLAANNNGLSEFLGTDDVKDRISDFYNKIRNPLLQNISVAFSAGKVTDTYPLRLPDIYVGEQLVMLGRYGEPGAAKALLHGAAAGKGYDFNYDVEFTADSLTHIFIPKMWAKYRIDALLELMSGTVPNSGQWKEYRDEIIRLSLKYGILSPFSSFSDPGHGGGSSSGIEEESSSRGAIAIRAYPNPFRSQTRLAFTVPPGGTRQATITIYDMSGRVVAVLLDTAMEPGEHEILWRGDDGRGGSLPAGSYLCEIRVGEERHAGVITLVR